MEITQRKTADLIPYVNNARTHSEQQVLQIAASIKEFGFNSPVLVDGDNGIIAGHGRVMAAKKLGLDEVPTIELKHLTKTQKKAYILADNRLALNSGWDNDLLALELGELSDDGFDLDLLGFDDTELSLLDEPETAEGLTDEDAVPDAPVEPITKLGDVWLCGNHRVMCGDSTSIDAVDKLMNGNKADMVFTDPPYGISIVNKSGHVGGGKLAKVGTYQPVANDESIDVAIEAIQIINTLNAKIEIIWGGNYYANSLKNSSCWIIWDKNNTGNFADAELAWTNLKTAVRIFKHTWNGMIKDSEHKEKRVHPTQKPIALAEWCFNEYGNDCNNIIDLFGGSGSTLIASEKNNKNCFMMELSPSYCDVIIKRWQDFTGKQAILESTGEPYGSHT